MRNIAIIQARMGSTRLPGKVLKQLAGVPMVLRVIERARRIAGVDDVVIATSTLAEEEPLIAVLRAAGVAITRGSSDDVLSRYLVAAREHRADTVVRITSDCPLLSPIISSRVVAAWDAARWDYVSNTRVRTYPRGLDTEMFSREGLERCAKDGRSSIEREHVTPHFYLNPQLFRILQIEDAVDRNMWRWTVDTPEDYTFVTAVYDALGPTADYAEIVAYIEKNPAVALLNSHIEQKPLGA